jgi:muramidase (phage lysozyme)
MFNLCQAIVLLALLQKFSTENMTQYIPMTTLVQEVSAAEEHKCVDIHPYSCLIREYADRYGIHDKSILMAKIIKCESGFNAKAENSKSTAAGLAQFTVNTWDSLPYHIRSRSRYEPEAAIEGLAYLISNGGLSHWNSSRGCWSK